MDLRLKATTRDQRGKRVRALRAEGKLPAVVYGHRAKATALLLDSHDFERVFARAGRTHLVDLQLDGGRAQKVLVREVQRSPRRAGPIHVDFYRVDLREKLAADVPILVVGEAPAVKRGDADLVQQTNHVRVECLPADIPEHFEVDVSALENVGDSVRVKDIPVPESIAILSDGEDVVVRAQARRELEPEAAEAEELPEAAAEGEGAGEAQAEPAAEAAPEG